MSLPLIVAPAITAFAAATDQPLADDVQSKQSRVRLQTSR